MKKVIALIAAFTAVAVTVFAVGFFTSKNHVPRISLTVYGDYKSVGENYDIAHGRQIDPSQGSYKNDFLPSFIPNGLKDKIIPRTHFANDFARPFEVDVNMGKMRVECPYHFDITIYDKDGEIVYTGSDTADVYFDKPGDYSVEITAGTDFEQSGFWASYSYKFTAKVDGQAQIIFSNTQPVQGELVKVEAENLFANSTVEVDSPVFAPGAVYYDRENRSAFFYLPITYYKPADKYEITVSVKGEYDTSHRQVLEVQKYQFGQISFDVDRDTSRATVNSRRANREYRQKIHPLYYTKDENVYWDGYMVKPVEETRISSQFGEERYINGSTVPERHSGIDYAAPKGTPVYSPAAGKVEFADFLQLSGNTVVIDHGLGLKSYFFHMDSLDVEPGQTVSRGDLLGKVGTTGYSTGPHLHFQVSIQNQPVNPRLLYK